MRTTYWDVLASPSSGTFFCVARGVQRKVANTIHELTSMSSWGTFICNG